MSTATDMLAKYLAAESSLLEGKEIRFADRLLKMEDLPSIIAGRKEWERRVAQESATANRIATIGGLETKVANFNPVPTQRYRSDRNY